MVTLRKSLSLSGPCHIRKSSQMYDNRKSSPKCEEGMNVQAKEVWHLGHCPACCLTFISSGYLGPWVEQCSGTVGMGAAKQGWCSVCIMNVLSQEEAQHRETAVGQVREC